MSESTAVAELETSTLEVTETSQADTPVESTPPTGDTGQQETADAAPANEAASLDAEYEAFLQTQESKEGETPAPEPEQQREEPPQPLVDPQVYATRQAEYTAAYNAAYAEVKSLHQELVDTGIPESSANRIAGSMAQKINSLHATGLNFHGLEAATQVKNRVENAWTAGLHRGIEATLPKAQMPAFDAWFAEQLKTKGAVPHEEWLPKVVEMRVQADGYVPKAKYEADKKNAWTEGRRAREKAGEVAGSASGAQISGAAGTRTNLTYSQILKMTPAQISAIPDDVYQKAVEEGK